VASEDDFEARFWRRKLDGIALDVSKKKCFPIEFKRTQDYRHTYEERARSRASEQYKSLLEGLQAIGSRKGWQIQQLGPLLVFVGGACGSVGQDSYNENLKVLEVQEGKWEMIAFLSVDWPHSTLKSRVHILADMFPSLLPRCVSR